MGAGFCDPDEKGMYTLTAADRHAVALPAAGRRARPCASRPPMRTRTWATACAGCLTANAAQGAAMACLSGDAANAACDVDLAGTLKVGGSPSCVGPVAAFAQNTRDEVRFVGGSGSHVGALAAHPGVKQASHVLQGPAVRRLTPLECERLQGFPDNWTNVEFRGKPAPDGRRYRASETPWPSRSSNGSARGWRRPFSLGERAGLFQGPPVLRYDEADEVRLEVGGVEPDDIARAEQLATSHPPTGARGRR